MHDGALFYHGAHPGRHKDGALNKPKDVIGTDVQLPEISSFVKMNRINSEKALKRHIKYDFAFRPTGTKMKPGEYHDTINPYPEAFSAIKESRGRNSARLLERPSSLNRISISPHDREPFKTGWNKNQSTPTPSVAKHPMNLKRIIKLTSRRRK